METYNIRHKVGIRASAEAVYETLTDTNKLAGWWVSDTRGDGSKVGGILEFRSEDFCRKIEVAELKPDKPVRWKYREGFEEWLGTEIAFSLTADEKQCYVHFSHTGWRGDRGSFSFCSTKWAVFLLSLKNFLEKGKGQPAPYDVEIEYDEIASRRHAA
jgi:uncharacterized protein YndB with AHSA1/START domain